MAGISVSRDIVVPRPISFVEANLHGWWRQSLGPWLEGHYGHSPTPLSKGAPGMYKQTNTLSADTYTITVSLRSLGTDRTQVTFNADVAPLPGRRHQPGPAAYGVVGAVLRWSFRKYSKDFAKYLLALPEPPSKGLG
jgi:hypothetical protein